MNENKKILVVIIARLVLVAAVIVGLLLFHNSTRKDPSPHGTTTNTTNAKETSQNEGSTSPQNVNDYKPTEQTTEGPEESSLAEESSVAPEEPSTEDLSAPSTTQASETAATATTAPPEVTVTSVTAVANTSEYENGYKLTKDDLTVTANFSDGTTKTVTDFNLVQSGTTVYVSYKAVRSNTITITYKISLISLTVETKMAAYSYGYQLTKNDLMVIAKYSDGSEKLVEDFAITQNNTSLFVSALGKDSRSVNINYISTVPNVLGKTFDQAKSLLEQNGLRASKLTKEEYSETYAAGLVMLQSISGEETTNSGRTIYLTVSKGKKPVVISYVTVTANAAEYESGYKLDKTDLTVIANYSDGSVAAVTDYTITQSEDFLYVMVEGIKSNTLTIKYKAPEVKSVTVTASASEYATGYRLTKNDLTVMATYADNSSAAVTDYTITQNGESLYVTVAGVTSNTITVQFVKPQKTVSSVTAVTREMYYEEDYRLSNDDLYVTVYYADGSDYNNYTDFTITQSGTSLYVTVAGVKSETITIQIKPPALTSVNIQLKDTQYEEGYKVDTYDLIVTAYYANGANKVVDIVTKDITHLDAAVYVTYQGVQSNTVTYTVIEPQVSRIPFLLGMTFDQAKAELEALGLVAVNAGEVYDPMIAAGEVCDQSFTAGSLVRKGTSVFLTISKGKDPTAHVIALNIALRSDAYDEGYTVTLTDLNVVAIYSDGTMKTVSDGVTLMDKSNSGSSPCGGITLTTDGSHYVAATYLGVESETIAIPVRNH